MRYTFGDSEIAARRLQLLAEVFSASSEPFLREALGDPPEWVVDLGCGPGFSTHFLAGILGCRRAIGLDQSESFINRAQESATDRVSFVIHDVTRVPFPVGPADLLYGRYLLTHLREPHSVVARWATQLRPGGLLLMEENEWIETENPTFRTYLEIVEAMLASQGTTLRVGAILNRLADSSGLTRRGSVIRPLRVADRTTATLFALNIRTWKRHPFIRAHYPLAQIDALEAELHELSEHPSTESRIEFGLRQLVFERA